MSQHNDSPKVTIRTLAQNKREGDKIAVLTAYDYSFAATLDAAGIDAIMIGDSLGMVMAGHDSTLPVTLDECVYHSACVARADTRALRIADLPFGSYQASAEQAFEAAAALMGEGGAEVVKLEGGAVMVPTVEFLASRGVPVCGHLGLTPQSVHQLGGYRVQGRESREAKLMLADAKMLESAGAAMIVLEAVPATLAAEITQAIGIPTIGIGAGAACDGQVLVLQDMLGIYPRPSPKFSRNFMDGAGSIEGAIRAYVQAVKDSSFPADEHSF